MSLDIKIESLVNDRFTDIIVLLIEQEKCKSFSRLGEAIGENPQSFTDIKAGKKRVSEDLINRICSFFPDINKAYITGGFKPKFHTDLISETDKRLTKIEDTLQEILTLLRQLKR